MTLKTVYICPTVKSSQCSWEGASEDILEHFIMEHEDLLFRSSEVDIDLKITSENRLLFLDGEIYLIQLIIDTHLLRIGLRYLGPKRIVDGISYDIALKVDGQLYFHNYFVSSSSIFGVNDGFWTVDLHKLKRFHHNLAMIQCNFSISKNLTEIQKFENVPRKPIGSSINPIEDQDNEEESSDPGTVIEDDEIEDILNEDIEFTSTIGRQDCDALDNMSIFNFNLLENSRYSRRYSSFVDIPQGMFDEREITNLSCTTCFINMLPPIYICINKHNICADCKYESCKVCYGNVTESRNKDLEEYSRKSLHLCRYHSEGCSESFMYNEIRNHEIKCTFCIYKCINNCTFRGKFSECNSHLKINHPSCKIFYSTPISFPRNSEFVVCDNKLGIFHCTSSYFKNTVRWVISFLGPNDRNFSCEINFKETKSINVSVLRKLEDQYSITHSKEDLKKMKVKDKNAVLTISSYFQ